MSAPIVDDNNRVKEREYTLKCPADSIGAGIPAFNFVPYWTVSVSGDTTELHDLAYMESTSHEVRRWQEHLENHRAMRDLLRISSWTEHLLSIEAVSRKMIPYGWRVVFHIRKDGARLPSRILTPTRMQDDSII